jgi:hypothetical protein
VLIHEENAFFSKLYSTTTLSRKAKKKKTKTEFVIQNAGSFRMSMFFQGQIQAESWLMFQNFQI